MEYSCTICDYHSTRKYDVERHRKSRKHQKKIEDNTMYNRTYKTKYRNTKMVPKPIPKNPSLCEHCGRYYAGQGTLNRHLRNIHNVDAGRVIKTEIRNH